MVPFSVASAVALVPLAVVPCATIDVPVAAVAVVVLSAGARVWLVSWQASASLSWLVFSSLCDPVGVTVVQRAGLESLCGVRPVGASLRGVGPVGAVTNPESGFEYSKQVSQK